MPSVYIGVGEILRRNANQWLSTEVLAWKASSQAASGRVHILSKTANREKTGTATKERRVEPCYLLY